MKTTLNNANAGVLAPVGIIPAISAEYSVRDAKWPDDVPW